MLTMMTMNHQNLHSTPWAQYSGAGDSERWIIINFRKMLIQSEAKATGVKGKSLNYPENLSATVGILRAPLRFAY